MADNLPQNFAVPGESAIASYNYTDIAEGTGIIRYGGFATNNTAGNDYHLDTNSFFSAIIDQKFNYSTASDFTKTGDLDFDLGEFNLPKTIRGTAYFNFCFGVEVGTSTAETKQYYPIIKIRKWDGVTETEIASVQGETDMYVGAEHQITFYTLKVTVPETNFKTGETLRITVEGWTKSEGTDQHTSIIACDPQNRDGTYIEPSTDSPETITKLECFIPYDIQL